MLSLLEAYLKQVRDTLHDVVKIIKEESNKPPKPCKKASQSIQEILWWGILKVLLLLKIFGLVK